MITPFPTDNSFDILSFVFYTFNLPERIKKFFLKIPKNCKLLYIYAWKQHKETPCAAIFISN
jgi:hypothetical protein